MILPLPSLAATEALGARLAALLRPGDAVIVIGVRGGVLDVKAWDGREGL